MTDLPHALVIDPRPQCYAETLTTRFADRCRFTFCSVEAEVDAALARADFQIVFEVGIADAPRAKLREVYLAPSLQWFQVGGSGYEHILPMERADVQVSNAAGVLAPFLAETIMGAMLAIEGQFFRYRDLQRARVWQPLDFGPLAGRTLLIVGLGAIGSELAKRAAAFDMRVLATRRTPAPDPHCAEVHPADALDALLPEADFVSLHLRLDAATHHTMNAARFARMKPGSVMINTARGKVVDTDALIDALRSGPVRAAYLDVFETEPLQPDHSLWKMDSVFMTPHSSDSIRDWNGKLADNFASNLDRWLNNEPLAKQIGPQ